MLFTLNKLGFVCLINFGQGVFSGIVSPNLQKEKRSPFVVTKIRKNILVQEGLRAKLIGQQGQFSVLGSNILLLLGRRVPDNDCKEYFGMVSLMLISGIAELFFGLSYHSCSAGQNELFRFSKNLDSRTCLA